jgi:hypothetical protein
MVRDDREMGDKARSGGKGNIQTFRICGIATTVVSDLLTDN